MANTNRARFSFLSASLALLPAVLVGLSAVAAGLGNPRQFAMEMTMTSDTDGAVNLSYYVGKDRIRVDLTIGDMLGGSYISVYEGDQVTTYTLIPQTKQYMKTVSSADEQADDGPALPFGSPEDADHPCHSDPDTSCNKTGSDTLLGRNVDVYLVKDVEDGAPTESTIWFDRELLVPVRVDSRDGVMEATSIRVGTQPDRLFEIPAGYTQMDISY